MEPIGLTIAEHWELFGALWGGAVFIISGVASWVAAKSGAKYAILSHDEKIKDNTARIVALEEKSRQVVMESKCEKFRQECQGNLEDDECGVTKKIDSLTAKIEDLERRRIERWESFERRREASKDSLQKTFDLFTKKITRMETIISERSKIFRSVNGKHSISTFEEIPCLFDEEEGNEQKFSNAV